MLDTEVSLEIARANALVRHTRSSSESGNAGSLTAHRNPRHEETGLTIPRSGAGHEDLREQKSIWGNSKVSP